MTFLEFLDSNNIHLIFAILISVLNAVLLVLVAKKFFQILQLSGYKTKGYVVWLKDTKAKYISRVTMLAFLSLACVLVTNFLFDVYNSEALYSYFGLIFYVYFTIVFVINANKAPQKTPLVQTRRMSRLMTLLFILAFAITFVLVWVATVYLQFLRFGIIVLTPILVPFLVLLVHFLTIPLEGLIRSVYIRKAKRKLAKFPDLIKIGLTGSYGKTSVKYILNKMLGEKYNVCITPHSFNTPMGVTKVVLKYLKKDHNLLIVEMGAKQVGDIKYLCDIVHPHHAVITGVGSQHYETFGSVENIAKTKFELVKALPANGICVFGGASEKSKELYEKCTLENKCIVDMGAGSFVQAQDVHFAPSGTTFNLCFNGETQKCFCALLGRHNLMNILLAAAMAMKLGVTLEQIANALSDVEPVSHRLEATTNGNITILDDAYSANEEGAKCALEVLAMFDGTKVCVTPGIVEMGAKEFATNKAFGAEMAKVCDYVIIVNKVNEASLKEGLLQGGFDESKILPVENLELAKKQISELTNTKEKFAILFCNDLPDNYT